MTNQEVMLDTNVYSLLFTRRQAPEDAETSRWRSVLLGRIVVISFQTREEILAGALAGGWGTARTDRVTAQLDRTITVWGTTEVVDHSTRLFAGCRASGHPLHQPAHRADRWIAASALAFDLPLATADRVFEGVPDLSLLSSTPR